MPETWSDGTPVTGGTRSLKDMQAWELHNILWELWEEREHVSADPELASLWVQADMAARIRAALGLVE